MVAVSYTKDSITYTVRGITDPAQVEIDVLEVLSSIGDTDLIAYKNRMYKSIEQGYAFEILKDTQRVGFVYNIVINDRYYGASINVTDTIGMLIAFKTMFEICDFHKIEFSPHYGNVKDFKSLIRGDILRVFYNKGRTMVAIIRDDVVPLGLKLFKYFGIELA